MEKAQCLCKLNTVLSKLILWLYIRSETCTCHCNINISPKSSWNGVFDQQRSGTCFIHH